MLKRIKKYYPFIFCFIIMLVIHSIIKSHSDDLFFKTQLDQYSLFGYLKMRYYSWSSRMIIETLFITFNRHLFIWKIVDSLIFSLIGLYISKLFNDKQKKEYDWIIVFLVLLYPFNDLGSAGYVTTSIAYAWPTLGLLYLINNIQNILEKNINLKWYDYILSVIAILIVTSMEQSCMLLLGFTSLYLIKLIYKKEFNLKKHWYIIFLLFSSIISLIFILTCPGNKIRTLSEIDHWYPNYANYGLKAKVYLGIVPTMSLFLRNKIILPIMSIFLCILTFKNKKSSIYKVLSLIVLSFCLTFGFFRMLTLNIYPSLELLTNIFDQQDIINNMHFVNILPFLLSIIIGVIILILIYANFGKKNLKPLFIYLASLCARIMMGFSPTIFASVDRTAFFTYFGFIILIYLMYTQIVEKNKNIIFYNSFFITLGIINVLNILSTLAIIFY